MEFCKYCGEQMMFQGNDRIEQEYIGIYVCLKCKGVYEKRTGTNGKYKGCRWWNPEKNSFEESK
ncbi:MAG: hypothetical protein RSF40_01460 [Oscillospiraceae bacterium]